jgi:hypothetical protein
MLFKPVANNGITEVNRQQEKDKKRDWLGPRKPGYQTKNHNKYQTDCQKQTGLFEMIEFYFDLLVNGKRQD